MEFNQRLPVAKGCVHLELRVRKRQRDLLTLTRSRVRLGLGNPRITVRVPLEADMVRGPGMSRQQRAYPNIRIWTECDPSTAGPSRRRKRSPIVWSFRFYWSDWAWLHMRRDRGRPSTADLAGQSLKTLWVGYSGRDSLSCCWNTL